MRCPQCGAENPEDSEFCGLCYYRFAGGGNAGQGAEEPPAVTGELPPPLQPPPPPPPTEKGTPAPPDAGTEVPPPPKAPPDAGTEVPRAAEAVAATAAAKASGGEDGAAEKPEKELPPEAETPEYWEQTYEALKQQSKTEYNTKKITIVAIVTVVVLAMFLLFAVFLLNNAKTRQVNNSQLSESVPAGTNSGSGTTPNQSSQTAPSGLTGKLSVKQVREITPATQLQKQIEITGSGFKSGISVTLISGNVLVQGTNVVVYDNTRLGCGIDLTGKADGSYNLVLRNPDAETVTLSGVLTVQSAP
jgi:hypothetical protein